MVSQWFRRLLLSALFCSMELYAYRASLREITSDRLFLQVGAYSHARSLQRMSHRLEKFPLWHDRVGGVTRLFVVLPKERSRRRRYLKEIKSIVPDAFIRHGYRPRHATGGEPLDSRAILRARKKFF